MLSLGFWKNANHFTVKFSTYSIRLEGNVIPVGNFLYIPCYLPKLVLSDPAIPHGILLNQAGVTAVAPAAAFTTTDMPTTSASFFGPSSQEYSLF